VLTSNTNRKEEKKR